MGRKYTVTTVVDLTICHSCLWVNEPLGLMPTKATSLGVGLSDQGQEGSPPIHWTGSVPAWA